MSLNIASRKVMSVARRDNMDDFDFTLNGIKMKEVDLFRCL